MVLAVASCSICITSIQVLRGGALIPPGQPFMHNRDRQKHQGWYSGDRCRYIDTLWFAGDLFHPLWTYLQSIDIENHQPLLHTHTHIYIYIYSGNLPNLWTPIWAGSNCQFAAGYCVLYLLHLHCYSHCFWNLLENYPNLIEKNGVVNNDSILSRYDNDGLSSRPLHSRSVTTRSRPTVEIFSQGKPLTLSPI